MCIRIYPSCSITNLFQTKSFPHRLTFQEEGISSNYMCYNTAKELRDKMNRPYSNMGNQSQIYELIIKCGEIRYEEDNVTKYFNSVERIWQDMDLFNDYEWNPTTNIPRKWLRRTASTNFLLDLNQNLIR